MTLVGDRGLVSVVRMGPILAHVHPVLRVGELLMFWASRNNDSGLHREDCCMNVQEVPP